MAWTVSKNENGVPVLSLSEFIQRNDYVDNKSNSSNKTTRSELDDFTSCSPVFEAWVRWDHEIKRSGDMALSSFSNDKTAVGLLTDYMHGHKIEVTEGVMCELLSLAHMLQVDDITNVCKLRVRCQSLNKENCLKILKTCSLYDIEHPCMDKFIRGNLIELSQRKDMLEITSDALEVLLTDEELSYWPMNDRFVFITDWCSTRDDRALIFETLFTYLDLNKIGKDILEKVVKNEKLVTESKTSIDKVNMHLCERQDTPIPFVFIPDVIRTGSNVLGFNLEDKQLYKFRFPDEIIDSNLVTVAESGHILSIKKTSNETYMYDYDINSNICKTKTLKSKERLPENLLHIVVANGRLFFIFGRKRDFPPLKGKRMMRGSILYEKISDDESTLTIEPLLTFTFDVRCACFSQSMIIVSSATYVKSSKLVCFHLETNKITETDIIHRIPNLQCMLPVSKKLFLTSYPNNCLILELAKNSSRYYIKDNTTSTRNMRYKTPEYIVCSDFIIEINCKKMRLCDARTGETDIKNFKSYDLDHLRFDYRKTVFGGYVDRTRMLCHIMCPHCDPWGWENLWQHQQHQQPKQRKQRKHNRYAPGYFDDYDDDLYYSDYDDDFEHSDHDDALGYSDYGDDLGHSDHHDDLDYSDYGDDLGHSDHHDDLDYSDYGDDLGHSDHHDDLDYSDYDDEYYYNDD